MVLHSGNALASAKFRRRPVRWLPGFCRARTQSMHPPQDSLKAVIYLSNAHFTRSWVDVDMDGNSERHAQR
jgi:hypothetical protein